MLSLAAQRANELSNFGLSVAGPPGKIQRTECQMIRSTTPSTSQRVEDLQAAKLLRIADLIRARTYDRVQNLAVTFAADSRGVLLSGQVRTFYVKQLAQHAALEAMPGETLYNEIEVRQVGAVEVRHAAEAATRPGHLAEFKSKKGA
jgi:osmotically-inducible protein OsmY